MQLILEKVLMLILCTLTRYPFIISTHRIPVSSTARTVNIKAIVFDLIDFRVITTPDSTLPIVPKTENRKYMNIPDRAYCEDYLLSYSAVTALVVSDETEYCGGQSYLEYRSISKLIGFTSDHKLFL